LCLQFILHLCVSDCVVLNSVLLCKTKTQARNVDTRRTETQNKDTEPETQTRVERMRSKLSCCRHFNTDHKNRSFVEMWLVLSTLFKIFFGVSPKISSGEYQVLGFINFFWEGVKVIKNTVLLTPSGRGLGSKISREAKRIISVEARARSLRNSAKLLFSTRTKISEKH
jgi:hypothetical protein